MGREKNSQLGLQLGSGNKDDQWVPKLVTGKQLEGRKVINASVGGQHSALLTRQLVNNPVLTSVINISLYSNLVLFCLYTCLSLSCCTCKQDHVRMKLGSVR